MASEWQANGKRMASEWQANGKLMASQWQANGKPMGLKRVVKRSVNPSSDSGFVAHSSSPLFRRALFVAHSSPPIPTLTLARSDSIPSHPIPSHSPTTSCGGRMGPVMFPVRVASPPGRSACRALPAPGTRPARVRRAGRPAACQRPGALPATGHALHPLSEARPASAWPVVRPAPGESSGRHGLG